MRFEPAAFSDRHGFPTKRVFAREASALQLLLDSSQLIERGLELWRVSSAALRYRHQEAQAILHIVQLPTANEPRSIRVWIRQQHPRKRLR